MAAFIVYRYVLSPNNVTGGLWQDLTVLSSKALRWHMPAASEDNLGLGGGIQWVLDPLFCERLIPSFPEDTVAGILDVMQWVTCTDLLDALQRGLATWSANNKALTFNDITSSIGCEEATADRNDPCMWELYIGVDDGLRY